MLSFYLLILWMLCLFIFYFVAVMPFCLLPFLSFYFECFLKVKDPNMKTRKGKPTMVGYQPTMPANAPTLTPVLL